MELGEDLLVLLILAVLIWLLWKVFGRTLTTNQPPANANTTVLQSIAQMEQDVAKALSTAATNLGQVSVSLIRNTMTGQINAAERYPVATPGAVNAQINRIVAGEQQTGALAGAGTTTAPAAYAGAAAGASVPAALGGFFQGITSGIYGLGNLPAVKTTEQDLNNLGNWAGQQVHNFTNWVGHVF